MRRKLIIIGLDPDFESLLDGLDSCWDILGYVAPNADESSRLMYLGSDSRLADLAELSEICYVFGLEKAHIKRRLASTATLEWATLIGKRALVDRSAKLGRGTVVQDLAFVGRSVTLGDHVKINVGAQVHHDAKIEDHVTVAPGAVILGRVQVHAEAFIGAGAVVLPRLTVGEGSVVGAGAVVTSHVPPGVTVVGIPGRVLGDSAVDGG